MPCLVLVGGGVGCGKTTFIKFLLENESTLLKSFDQDFHSQNEVFNFFVLHFDELCSIDEQKQLMKTLRGWRDFRNDLLMAAERLISSNYESETGISGPLTQRSNRLLEKLTLMMNLSSSNFSNTIILVEDNFYYRSMRYDWFQIARRTNLGFATIFLHCPLSTAMERNSSRGYHIPEEKIRKMNSLLEHPDPIKYRWEKFSIMFDSAPELNQTYVKYVIDVVKEAMKHPAEVVISEQKIEAQKICSKNVIHQTDQILRKILSKKISSFKEATPEENLKPVVSNLVNIRQKMLQGIKHGEVDLPQDLIDKIQNLGVESVLDTYEKTLERIFDLTLKENMYSNL